MKCSKCGAIVAAVLFAVMFLAGSIFYKNPVGHFTQVTLPEQISLHPLLVPRPRPATFDCNGTEVALTLDHIYKSVGVSPGRCQWQIDEKAEKRQSDREDHRRKLWGALRTRRLTPKEMKEVAAYGAQINIETGVSFSEAEKLIELQSALIFQQTMQLQHRRAP